MSGTTAFVVYADTNAVDVLRACPPLDRVATRALVDRLFPDRRAEEVGDELLHVAVNPPADIAYIGCYPGLDLVCTWQLVGDRPSQLTDRLVPGTERRNVYLHSMHPEVEWCAYAVWIDGELIRAMSACVEPGVIEDIGEQLPFEQPYWDGERGPLELGEAALRAFVGFNLVGEDSIDDVDPEIIPLVGYRLSEPDAP